ncbi:MAG: hypothetical protein ACMUHU_07695, partial [Thermoplasmatota archaeon]
MLTGSSIVGGAGPASSMEATLGSTSAFTGFTAGVWGEGDWPGLWYDDPMSSAAPGGRGAEAIEGPSDPEPSLDVGGSASLTTGPNVEICWGSSPSIGGGAGIILSSSRFLRTSARMMT